jgi:hypothetical protein
VRVRSSKMMCVPSWFWFSAHRPTRMRRPVRRRHGVDPGGELVQRVPQLLFRTAPHRRSSIARVSADIPREV